MSHKQIADAVFTSMLIVTAAFWIWFVIVHADKVFFRHKAASADFFQATT